MHHILKREYIIALLDVVILIFVGLLSAILFFRIDMTSDASVSVRPVTRQLLSSLDDTLSITYFVSPTLESYTGGIIHIDAKLREFAAESTFVSYQKCDPLATGSGKNVESYGLVPRQINTIRNNTEVTTTVYSGIVFEYKGTKDVIPVLYEPQNLEYMVSSCISRLIFQRERNVAVIVPDNSASIQTVFAHIPSWLSSYGFNATLVVGGSDFSFYDAVIVFGDDTLSAETIAAVTTFSQAGGAVLAAISPSTVSLHSDWTCTPVTQHGLGMLLADFGITMHDAMIRDQSNVRLQLAAQNESGFEYVDYPLWVQVLPSLLNRNHLVTSCLNGLTCFWPGYLSYESGVRDVTECVPLAYSSTHSFVEYPPFNTNPYRVSPSYEEKSDGYCLAIAAVRTVKDRESRLIAISDALFASDAIQVSASVFNLDFLANSVEWLTGNDELLSLKSSGAGIRALEFDPNNGDNVRSAFYTVLMCCVGMPVLILFVMLFLLLYRRKQK